MLPLLWYIRNRPRQARHSFHFTPAIHFFNLNQQLLYPHKLGKNDIKTTVAMVILGTDRTQHQNMLNSLLALDFNRLQIKLYFVAPKERRRFAAACSNFIVNHGNTFGAARLFEVDGTNSLSVFRRIAPVIDCDYTIVSESSLSFDPQSITRVMAQAAGSLPTCCSWGFRTLPESTNLYYHPLSFKCSLHDTSCVMYRSKDFKLLQQAPEFADEALNRISISYYLRSRGFDLAFCPYAKVYSTAPSHKNTLSWEGPLLLRLAYADLTSLLEFFTYQLYNLFRGRKRRSKTKLALHDFLTALRIRLKSRCKIRFLANGFDAIREMSDLEGDTQPDLTASIIMRTSGERHDLFFQSLISACNQTHANLEIIVVENGGQTLREKVAELGQKSGRSIIYISSLKKDRILAGNLGLKRASGDLLMFLDDDDILWPDHVESLVRAACRYQKGLVACKSWVVHLRGAKRVDDFSDPNLCMQRFNHKKHRFSPDMLKQSNFFPIQAVMFSKELYLKKGGFDTCLSGYEDWELWLRYDTQEHPYYLNCTTSIFRNSLDPEYMQQKRHCQAQARKVLEEKYNLLPVTMNEV
jgi:hypothetical protein